MCLWIGSGKPMGASAGASPRVVVRPAQPQDQAAIAAFNQAMALETENRPLDLATVQAGVAQLMARPELGFYVVAEVAGEPVACLLVTREWSDWRNGLFWWIQSVYVHPHHRRQGLFRRLYGQVETWPASKAMCVGYGCMWKRTTPQPKPPIRLWVWPPRPTKFTNPPFLTSQRWRRGEASRQSSF
jgi:GNAT superfamily N-acetyltransferase